MLACIRHCKGLPLSPAEEAPDLLIFVCTVWAVLGALRLLQVWDCAADVWTYSHVACCAGVVVASALFYATRFCGRRLGAVPWRLLGSFLVCALSIQAAAVHVKEDGPGAERVCSQVRLGPGQSYIVLTIGPVANLGPTMAWLVPVLVCTSSVVREVLDYHRDERNFGTDIPPLVCVAFLVFLFFGHRGEAARRRQAAQDDSDSQEGSPPELQFSPVLAPAPSGCPQPSGGAPAALPDLEQALRPLPGQVAKGDEPPEVQAGAKLDKEELATAPGSGPVGSGPVGSGPSGLSSDKVSPRSRPPSLPGTQPQPPRLVGRPLEICERRLEGAQEGSTPPRARPRSTSPRAGHASAASRAGSSCASGPTSASLGSMRQSADQGLAPATAFATHASGSPRGSFCSSGAGGDSQAGVSPYVSDRSGISLVSAGHYAEQAAYAAIAGQWALVETANHPESWYVHSWLASLTISGTSVRDGDGKTTRLLYRDGEVWLHGGKMVMDGRFLLRISKSQACCVYKRVMGQGPDFHIA